MKKNICLFQKHNPFHNLNLHIAHNKKSVVLYMMKFLDNSIYIQGADLIVDTERGGDSRFDEVKDKFVIWKMSFALPISLGFLGKRRNATMETKFRSPTEKYRAFVTGDDGGK